MSKRADIANLQRQTANLLLGIEAADRHLDRLVDRVEALEDANRRQSADDPHTGDLRNRIVKVIDYHGYNGKCQCKVIVDGFNDWNTHIADAIVRELKLEDDVDLT